MAENTICILLLAAFALLSIATPVNGREDVQHRNYHEKVLESTYHGLIKENETFVELMPQLRVDAKICGFHILRNTHKGDIPFQIELEGNVGVIQAVRSLNCEKRKTYKFEVSAVLCNGGSYSKPAQVRISVIDINEYAPTFLQPSYTVQMDEGRLYKEIVRLEAVDKDCTPLFGDVCKYEILQKDGQTEGLFDINAEGAIRNIQPLSFKKAHNHILSVIAYDCAMKASAPVMVNIKVNRVCEARLTGVPERIDYVANSAEENVVLFPNVGLELCDLVPALNDSFSSDTSKFLVEAEVELKTNHISYGCDRDSLVSRCDMKEQKVNGQGQYVDLLGHDKSWTKELNADEVLKSQDDDVIYHFDGTTGALVPNVAVNSFDFSNTSDAAHHGIRFSILTMFRHRNNLATAIGGDKKTVEAIKHQKEHLLCTADNHKMNRHHMALFVRNCRLIFLLRRNSHAPQMNIFAPAEWRWKIPQVCDNEWHTYVVNVRTNLNATVDAGNSDDEEGIQVELFVDGEPVKSAAHRVDQDQEQEEHGGRLGMNPEVIDDWPLHAAHGVGTALTIGACYQGAESRMKHFFNGDMAQLKLALNYNFDKAQIQCGLECREYLQVGSGVQSSEGTARTMINRQRNLVKVEASSPALAEKMLRSVQYTNRKTSPTVGRRNLVIRTKLRVNEEEDQLHALPSIDSYIMVSGGQQQRNGEDMPMNKKIWPRIVIEGNDNHYVSYLDIKTGVRIMEGLKIVVRSDQGPRAERSEAATTTTQVNYKRGESKDDDEEANKWSDNSVNLIDDTDDDDNDEEADAEDQEEAEIEEDELAAGAIRDDEHVAARLQFLDNCQLTIFPNLNTDHEEIKVAGQNATTESGSGATTGTKSFFYGDVNVELSVNGLRLSGYDTVANYEYLLQNLYYMNRKPAYYLNRIFKLKCSQLDGRMESNDFQSTLTVLHPKQAVPTGATGATATTNTGSETVVAATPQKPVEEGVAASKVEAVFSHSMIHQAMIDESPSRLRQTADESVTSPMVHHGHAHLLIIAICACFVLIIGGVGIARLKGRVNVKHGGAVGGNGMSGGNIEGGDFKLLAQDEMEMLEEEKHHQQNQLDWDDTPLTITVNPMQNWVDEDEEQGIEYLMGGGKGGKGAAGKRGMSKLGGPTLHLSGAGHLMEEEDDDELDTSDSEDEEEEEMDSDEDDDDTADSGGSEGELDLNESSRTYSSRGGAAAVHSGSSSNSNNNTSCSKKGKRVSRAATDDHQLEWDNSTL